MANIDKIKQLAKEKGIKIKYICSRLGLAETYLSNVKNGRDHMTDQRLGIIADILGTTTAYLNDETDDPSYNSNFVPYSVSLYDGKGLLVQKVLKKDQIELLEKIIQQLH